MPGLAKTLLIKSLGTALGLQFERIQFTPDLLPSDVVGTMVFQPKDGQFTPASRADFRQPRPGRRNQPRPRESAERAARGDAGATGHDRRHVASRCPTRSSSWRRKTPSSRRARIRFLKRSAIASSSSSSSTIPTRTNECEMMRRWGQVTVAAGACLRLPTARSCSRSAREVDRDPRLDAIQAYILALVTRHPRPRRQWHRPLRRAAATTPSYLSYGASPRASLALYQAGKALAWLARPGSRDARRSCRKFSLDVMRHRIGLTYEAEAEDITPDKTHARPSRSHPRARRARSAARGIMTASASKSARPLPFRVALIDCG